MDLRTCREKHADQLIEILKDTKKRMWILDLASKLGRSVRYVHSLVSSNERFSIARKGKIVSYYEIGLKGK